MKNEKIKLLTLGNDARRIEYYTGIRPNFTDDDKVLLDIFNFKQASTTLLLDIHENVDNQIIPLDYVNSFEGSKLELLYSSYTNLRKKRKHLLYRYTYNNAHANEIDITPEYTNDQENNILNDGGFELLLHGEEALEKFSPYSYMRDFKICSTNNFISPQSGYFWTSEKADKNITGFGSYIDNPLYGNSSLYMKAGSEPLLYRFHQRFKKGEYELSVDLKGTKGTEITLLYDIRSNGLNILNNIVIYELPNEKTYRISGRFNCQISEDEFFLLGIWLRNGEAILDNVKLKKIEL